MNNTLVTVFTPTYNRALTLPRLWESLKRQDSFQFEWLVIDDGSNDNTADVIDKMKDNTFEFEIIYKKQENGGKHRAINYGVNIATGELFFIVDSDDWLPPNSISTIINYYSQIKDNCEFVGIAGCKFDSREKMSGKTFEGEYVDATALDRSALGIKGEKAEVFFTKILQKYPFPEFENERFISESVVWNKIAADGYKMRWFNKNIYYYEYQEDGLTNRLRENYRDNPKGYLTFISNETKYLKIKGIKRFVWFGRCIDTVENVLSQKEIRKMLGICYLEYCISKFLFKLYNLVR